MATPPVTRPFNPPVIAPDRAPARQAPDARAAQRAFFQQALGDTTPVAAPQAPVQAAQSRAMEPVVTRVQTQPIPDAKPAGYKRPGSYIDIKV